ncbi:MAG: response regulator [Defluviitaleaceae bacterium]|nr:response regulator [Defluviitaleaceae bacterium]
MYQLLIVEDERMIADLLYEAISAELEDEVVILKAYSARTAINIMDESIIDIIVTDINMPGINGLDLAKAFMLVNPRCKVIFLTGFNDFSAIQYALRNNSVDFILKSESNDVIFNAIRKALKTLDDELHMENMRVLSNRQWELSLPIMQERLVLALLDGELFVKEAFTEVKFPLCPDNRVRLMMARADGNATISGTDLYKLKCSVDEYLNIDVFSVIKGNDIIWFLQSPNKVNFNMAAIQDLCHKSFNTMMSFVLSEDFVKFEEIFSALHGMKQTILNMHTLSPGMLLIENSQQKDALGLRRTIGNIMRKINLSIESLQRESYESQMAELGGIIQSTQPDASAKIEIALHVYLAFLSRANMGGVSLDVGFSMFLSCDDDWDKFTKLFEKIAEDFFTKHYETAFKHTNEVLGNLRRYIHANLDGDTSLNKLAEISHFNPSYLSRLFKQLTNESLSEYIGRLKYKKAVKLLTETDMKIIQISTELGFETQSYFWRFFKKYAGVGPQEFKEANNEIPVV